ncbi:MAG: hypothetical protein OEM40_07325 [Acidimicrobiia bacterium]|nr:hypothetical protein [Acidimicrobiia bacterium]
MCRQVTCSSCGRPTWAGCGRHVDQVLGHVPEAERCHCGNEGARNDSGASSSWFSRLFGR